MFVLFIILSMLTKQTHVTTNVYVVQITTLLIETHVKLGNYPVSTISPIIIIIYNITMVEITFYKSTWLKYFGISFSKDLILQDVSSC